MTQRHCVGVGAARFCGHRGNLTLCRQVYKRRRIESRSQISSAGQMSVSIDPPAHVLDAQIMAEPGSRCAIRSVIEHLPRSSHGTRWMRRPGGVSRGCGGAREVPMGPNVPPRASRARLPFPTAGVEGCGRPGHGGRSGLGWRHLHRKLVNL